MQKRVDILVKTIEKEIEQEPHVKKVIQTSSVNEDVEMKSDSDQSDEEDEPMQTNQDQESEDDEDAKIRVG